jgi:uncharacterized membrane protein YphA (DoxX/SURF4 family)
MQAALIQAKDLRWIRFFARSLLGILLLMAGWWKVFELGAANHAQQFFVSAFSDDWIPEWLLWSLGMVIPYWELAAGIVLLLGPYSRAVAISLGFLLLLTTYGHALQQPLYDIDGHTFTRLMLVFIVILIPANVDLLVRRAR